MTELIERVSMRMRSSQTLRLLTVGVLVLLLQIPIAMIGGQVSEREARGIEAIEEVSSKWGNEQVISGPALVVPFLFRWTEANREGLPIARSESRFAYFLPDRLTVGGTVNTEIRKRGIFSVPVYKADLTLSGRFSRPDFSDLGVEPAAIAWDRAHLVVGISDTRAIQQETAVSWNGAQVAFVPGTGGFTDAGSGIHAVVGFDAKAEAVDFSLPLALNGSRGVYFTPFGQNTVIELESNYPHPSLQGNWLPNDRTVSNEGFEARWSIPFLGRSFPQAWTSVDDMEAEI
ncbi:MAG: cell envelope integrity protein CreD, partial [Gammaproteobacteria bacterium]|nr:cell envelope integrity protein CreD [Gammaproteobacteria bacterium]